VRRAFGAFNEAVWMIGRWAGISGLWGIATFLLMRVQHLDIGQMEVNEDCE